MQFSPITLGVETTTEEKAIFHFALNNKDTVEREAKALQTINLAEQSRDELRVILRNQVLAFPRPPKSNRWLNAAWLCMNIDLTQRPTAPALYEMLKN